MDVNPCETCVGTCPYRLSINCPDWLAWAAVNNLEGAICEEGNDGLETS